MTPDEIKALCNTWPGKPGAAIIPHKPTKKEKRILLPIGADWELDVDPFKSQAAAPAGAWPFIHAEGGREVVPWPCKPGSLLYVDELVEVIERPDDAEWVRVRFMADDERRQHLFEPSEPRPKLGLLRYKHLPIRYARTDRLLVKSIEVARLWDIEEAGAEAEGAPLINQRRGTYYPNATRRMGYEANWNQLHAPLHSFDKANWWVAVVTFSREFEE